MLGTSSPPVRVMAMRIARARALKAASALDGQLVSSHCCFDAHVVVVLAANVVNVQCDTSSESKRLEQMRNHLGRH